MGSGKRRTLLFLIIGLWLCGVGVGLKYLWAYEVSAGTAATPSATWPHDSQIKPHKGQATLVLLAHPHCPCTRATVGELAALMAHTQGKVAAYVLFYKPEGFPESWEKTDLWQSAAAIPGVTVLSDDSGIEAKRFGAATSGQAMLYSETGKLLFSGGITGSRGHSGDNAGRDAIESLILNGSAEHSTTSVYGCDLLGKDMNSTDKNACPTIKTK
jgi:hypothetical protein